VVELQADGMVSRSTARAWLQKYRTDGQVGRSRGAGLWRVSSPAQDAASVAELKGTLTLVQESFRLLPTFRSETYGYFETSRSCTQTTTRCSGILDIFLKTPGLENSSLKG
jgi:hypothetical protein